ncbi:MAG: ATP-binding protein [Pseudomonadota bacterium]|nr:ATP-binding protein [Pseudomonadota bacterium]
MGTMPVFPPSLTLASLRLPHGSAPFNPLLASAFFRAGYVESWGRGIEKMRRECANHDAPAPIFDTSMSGLMLTFRANPAHLAAIGEHSGPTTQETTQERICRLLRGEPGLTRRELGERLSLTPDGVKYHLEKLKAAGRIRHVGPTKAGRWEVLK